MHGYRRETSLRHTNGEPSDFRRAPMKALITGAAGFIGSHLCERLLEEGYDVVGVDKFLDNYPRQFKVKNIAGLLKRPHFRFLEEDLLQLDLKQILNDITYVFHLAAQPGVRSSWGAEFI